VRCERVDLGGGKVAIVCTSRTLPKPSSKAASPAAKRKPAKVTLPATRQALLDAGWNLCYSRNCRLCHRPIDFWFTPKGRYMPMERDKEPPHLLRSHFETCPHAEKFRREPPAKAAQKGLFE
jgi:hypothetical protein